MNLNHARYIIAIYESGGVSLAAAKLFISQSALSQTVRQVETELGGPLFSRRSGKLSLTYTGERYIMTAREMLRLELMLQRELSEARDEKRGVLRFGVPAQQGMTLLPGVLGKFLRMYPDVRLEITEGGSHSLAQAVAEGTLDMALSRGAPEYSTLERISIQRERIGLIAGAGAIICENFADGTEISLKDAANERFVFLKKGHNARAIQDELAKKLGIKLNMLLELDTYETAKRVTLACGAVMLSPYSLHKGAIGCSYPISELKEAQDTGIIYAKGAYLTRYLKDFAQLVIDFYKEEEP